MPIPALSYPQIESLLADLHHVPSQGRVALMGRIKHLQRKGWPGGTNTGRGRPAAYDMPAVIDLLLAFEFIALRVPPDQVVGLMRRLPWRDVSAYLGRLGGKLSSGAKDGSRQRGSILADPALLIFDPEGLGGLRGTQPTMGGSVWLGIEGEGDLADTLQHRHFVAINLARLFLEAADYLERAEGLSQIEFGFALGDWAEAVERSGD